MPESSGHSWPPFEPGPVLGNAHVQSVLTSGPMRRKRVQRRAVGYLQRSRSQVLEARDGTRLLGHATRTEQPMAGVRPLVILLHGWEGSAESNYLLSTAVALDEAGFDTFRLNFRDHGESHHLNLGLFHSCLLDEVLDAVAQVAGQHHDGPVFLAGFSLGGNFTLRVARHAPGHGISLQQAFAVSPVIRPLHVLDALENGPVIYHYYFVRKWRRSLKIKQSLYPDVYRLDDWFRLKNLREQTDWLVRNETDFASLDDYLEGYSVAGDYLTGLSVPTTIVTAADDPIIPVSDFELIPTLPELAVEVLEQGGHCGFIENWRMESWIEKRLIGELCQTIRNV